VKGRTPAPEDDEALLADLTVKVDFSETAAPLAFVPMAVRVWVPWSPDGIVIVTITSPEEFAENVPKPWPVSSVRLRLDPGAKPVKSNVSDPPVAGDCVLSVTWALGQFPGG